MLEKSLEAINVAAHKTAVEMTAEIRRSATEHGWHPDVVNNLYVGYDKGKFKVNVEPEFEERAHIHEYGSETSRPTAVLRKFSTTSAHQPILSKHLSSGLRGTK
jgi:hypothetical protein